jgi:NAD(P)-dependent dehydrogenase (short-subunit alcohol dehydrogenase family)
MKIEGLTAVTGAGQGIGLAVTVELARRGFDVLALVLLDGMKAAVEEAVHGLPGRVRSEVLDVTKPGDFLFPDETRVLVNNAGIRLGTLPVEETPLSEWRAIMEVNFFGTLELSRRVIPVMRKAGFGVICNITSGSLLMPMPFLGPYRSSKAAVSALCETLRVELAPLGIRVIEILPGSTVSGFNADSPAGNKAGAVNFPPYAPMAEALYQLNVKRYKTPTPAEDAAARIVDAILEDDGPMRYGTDKLSNAGLKAWRETSDEAVAARALAPFAGIIPKKGSPV